MGEVESDQAAREVWFVMSELVLDNERRREVSEAVGLSFARVRALRRIAQAPMTLGELAAALSIDAPNCTAVVDDLETRGLVERRPNPADRRSKLVVTTATGTRLGKKAQGLLDRPPAALRDLAPHDLQTLARLFAKLKTPSSPQ